LHDQTPPHQSKVKAGFVLYGIVGRIDFISRQTDRSIEPSFYYIVAALGRRDGCSALAL
jgi:hypothetical protein